MKKQIMSIAFAVLAIVGTTTITSCKKGENDPFLSLKSRKGRVTGEWNLTSGTTTSTSAGNTTTVTFDASTASVAQGGTTQSFPYTVKITFEKDNTFERITTNDGVVTTEKGSWYFANKSKNLELKNKEAIILSISSFTNSNGTSTYTGIWADQIMVIDQLKNKEIIFKGETTETSGGSTDTEKYEFTYTQS